MAETAGQRIATSSPQTSAGWIHWEEEGGLRVGCRYEFYDRLAWRICEIEITDRREVDLPEDSLITRAQRLAAATVYLDEPLAVIEADAVNRQVLLRSRAPSFEGEGSRAYYEVVLSGRFGPRARFQRYRQPENGERTLVTFDLTRNVLGRLIDDLVLAAKP